ncbi:hypothetical protein UVI_02060300 [Ustilaginoidea virens]|uniref:Uncharacterized protein n=1 Tax=Ustilaginoidea virens TaxID=1159556 RepID=A0A1B5L3K9_USTVR|nr:hypothetical protein UVI_02060300 [Ustilaginoidea virens]
MAADTYQTNAILVDAVLMPRLAGRLEDFDIRTRFERFEVCGDPP